jgi:TatD DNase family protein
VIDSHTHLHLCKPPDAELVSAAAEAGVVKMLTVGTDPESCRAALRAAEEHSGVVFAAIGHHPNSASGFGDGDLAVLRELAVDDRCVAIGETGLDYYRDYAPRADQERAFIAHIELARELRKPLVIHTRAAEDDTLSMLSAQAGDLDVILHCFSMPERIDECLAHERWWISFAGNATYPKATGLRSAALRVPAERLLVETDAPYLSPQPIRGKPNSPAHVVDTAHALAVERRVSYEQLEASIEAAAARLFGW